MAVVASSVFCANLGNSSDSLFNTASWTVSESVAFSQDSLNLANSSVLVGSPRADSVFEII